MEKVLSISVAAYNVEAFLKNTLQSFVTDDAHMALLEVIVVNDGSRDGTENIARWYEDRYPDTFRSVNKENGGYGSTINTSVSLAKGRYFKLVDGDDWVDPVALNALIDLLRTTDADAVLTKYCAVEEESGNRNVIDEGFLFDGKAHSSDVFFGHFLPMHFLTVKTSILREHNIRITEKCFYTDLEFVTKLLPHISTVVLLDATVYQYRTGRNEQSVSIRSWQKNLDQAIRVTGNLCNFYNTLSSENGTDVRMMRYIQDKIVESALNNYRIFLSFPNDRKIRKSILDYDRELKEMNRKIHLCCRKNILICLLMLPGMPFYVILSRVYRIHLKHQGLL